MTFKDYYSQKTDVAAKLTPGVQSRHMHPTLRDVPTNAKYPGRVVPHYLRADNNRIQKIENAKRAVKGAFIPLNSRELRRIKRLYNVDYNIHEPKALKGIPSVTLEYDPVAKRAGLRKN